MKITNKITNKIIVIFMIAMLVLATLAGCSNTNDKNSSEQSENKNSESKPNTTDNTDKSVAKDPINLMLTGDISSLDTTLVRDQATGTILSNAVSSLFSVDEKGKTINEICEDYTISDDSLTYTFKLKNNYKWSNGETVDANDFVYAWRRLANPNTGATYASFISMANIINAKEVIKGTKPLEELGVSAPDDFTLEVKLHTPMPSFIQFISETNFCPLNQKFVEEKKDKFGTSVENTLFCGPYVIEAWEAEYSVTLAKNPDYPLLDTVKNDKVVYKIVKDVNTSINLFDTGELDVLRVRGEVAEIYGDDQRIQSFNTLTMRFFTMNNESPILSNVNARKAIASVIDKSFIADEIYNDGSVIADYIVSRGIAFNDKSEDFRDLASTYPTYNEENGKKYWEAAKKELNMDNYEIRLVVGESSLSKKMGEYMQSTLQSALDGLTVKFEQTTAKNDIQKEIEGEFDIKFVGWGNETKDAVYPLQLFSDGFYANTARFYDDEYQELYLKIMNDYVLDIDKRWECMRRAEEILISEKMGIIPVLQTNEQYLIQNGITGYFQGNLQPNTCLKYIEKK